MSLVCHPHCHEKGCFVDDPACGHYKIVCRASRTEEEKRLEIKRYEVRSGAGLETEWRSS